MNFHLVSEYKLKAMLNKKDMHKLNITYKNMDCKDKNSRKTLCKILEEGKVLTGFMPRDNKLFVQIFPEENGGCIIFFNILKHTNDIAYGFFAPDPVVFEFLEFDNIITAAAKVWNRLRHKIDKSFVYKINGRYILVVYPLDYADMLSIAFIYEFADIIGTGFIKNAYICEHGELLLADNALEILHEYFS